MQTNKKKNINTTKKVLIVGASTSGNLGAVAMTLSVVNFLRENGYSSENIGIASTRYEFDLQHNSSNFSGTRLFPHNQVVRRSLPYAFLNRFLKIKKSTNSFEAYIWADTIIDIHGINFVSKEPFVSSIIIPGVIILIAKILNKKIIKFTQSFGPIEGFFHNLVSKFFLQYADLIIPREPNSEEQLKQLGIKNYVSYRTDSAFNLHSSDFRSDFIQQDSNRIKMGFCLSATSAVKSEMYEVQAKNLIEALSNQYDIYLFAHYSSPGSKKERDLLVQSNNLDENLVNKIFDSFNGHKGIYKIPPFSSPDQVKGAIKSFDILISSRYHACIAGISSLVPTIPFFSWSYKYESIQEESGMTKRISLLERNCEDHLSIVKEVVNQKNNYVKKLINNQDRLKSSSSSAYELLKEHI